MTTTTFQPSIFLSRPSLANFLSGDEEAAAILRSPLSPRITIQASTCDEIYDHIAAFFQACASYLVYAVCMSDLSKRLWVKSCHTMHHITAIKAQNVFQNNLLSHSVNMHRKDTADYFVQGPLQTTLVKLCTPGVLNFFHRDGICRGMCHWFVHLYFKTYAHMLDSEQNLIAVGKQFEEGSPRQAAFLHSVDPGSPYELLGWNVTTEVAKISVEGKTDDQIIGEFQLCPPGVYGIYTSSHQVVYIKIDESRQYLFDPNRGLIKITSAHLFKHAMEVYFKIHDRRQVIYVDLYASH